VTLPEDPVTIIWDTMLKQLPNNHPEKELQRFYNLLRDYPLRQGKGLRGKLVLLSTAAHGGSWREGVRAAAALELFQNWVLIHDDIEDGSERRRGSPTLHKKAGIPLAINAGDALHVYMWQLLLSNKGEPCSRKSAVLEEFLYMIHRTAEGQHLDLSWVEQERFDIGEEDYLQMVTLKTSWYTIISPLRLGAFCAGTAASDVFVAAGEELGAAFQIRDDVLNLQKTPTYGKEFAGDLYEGKRTLILAHFFAHAREKEASEVRRFLLLPRHEKSEAGIRMILAYLEAHGSIRYAQGVAERKLTSGLEQLATTLGSLTNQAAAGELARLLESLVHRQE